MRLDPQYAFAYNNRGISHLNLGQFQRAIQDFDEALRLDPQYAQAYGIRALAYTYLGEDLEAQQDAERAIELGIDRAFLESAMEEAKRNR